MAGLPSGERAKLEELRAAEATKFSEMPKQDQKPKAFVSFTPDPMGEVKKENDPPPVENASNVVPISNEVSMTEATQQSAINFEGELRDLTHKYKTVAGQYEKLKHEKLQTSSEIDNLKATIKELQSQVSKQITEKAPSPVGGDLTPDELGTYGEAKPFVEKVARQVARAELEELRQKVNELTQHIGELNLSSKNVNLSLQNNNQRAFHLQIKSLVPNVDDILRNNEWADYLESKIPYANITMKQALAHAVEAFDVDSAAEIFKNFKPKTKNRAIESMVSPNLSSGGNSSTNRLGEQTKPILKFSDRKRASNDFVKGKLSREDMRKIDEQFRLAELEGRLDYNA
jgi:hypothetical protein